MSTEDAPILRNRFDNKNEVNEENISVNLLRKSSLSRSRVKNLKLNLQKFYKIVYLLVNVS